MVYEVSHRTIYSYDKPVSISHHLGHLSPRQSRTQVCLEHEVTIDPAPSSRSVHEDYFGNSAIFFAMRGAHKGLSVIARSKVEMRTVPPPVASGTPPWETIRDASRTDALTEDSLAGEFSFPSYHIHPGAIFATYALLAFRPGRPILEAALDLNHRINREWKFDSAATDVATPVEEAFEKRRGVCQDFAHILIACLRSIGLPARYVSGYLETLPPPGKAKLVGADASHAWLSIWCGLKDGWVDLDPTNDCIPGPRHITIAHGRDFFDVSPLQGVVYGQGDHELEVAVDVTPLKPRSSEPLDPASATTAPPSGADSIQNQSQSQSQIRSDTPLARF